MIFLSTISGLLVACIVGNLARLAVHTDLLSSISKKDVAGCIAGLR